MKTQTLILFLVATVCVRTHGQTSQGEGQIPTGDTPLVAKSEAREPAAGFPKLKAATLTKTPNAAVLREEMGAKERLLLFQKLGRYEERASRGDMPRLRSDPEFHEVELVRQKVADVEARDKREQGRDRKRPATTDRVPVKRNENTQPEAGKEEVKAPAGRTEVKPEANEATGTAYTQPAPTTAEPAAPTANTPPKLTPVGRPTGSVLKSKEQQLDELLKAYEAGLIKSRHYHMLRNALLEEQP
jgi:hypothetical protein